MSERTFKTKLYTRRKRFPVSQRSSVCIVGKEGLKSPESQDVTTEKERNQISVAAMLPLQHRRCLKRKNP